MGDDGKPWARIPGETSKQYAAFQAFLDMPPGRRSLSGLNRQLGRAESSTRHLERWASSNDWQGRADAYDLEQLTEGMAQRTQLREELRQRLYQIGHESIEILADLRLGRMPDGDVVEVLDKHQNVIGHRPVVSPAVRLQATNRCLELIGLQVPKRRELPADDANEVRMAARAKLATLTRDQLQELREFFHAVRSQGADPTGHPGGG